MSNILSDEIAKVDQLGRASFAIEISGKILEYFTHSTDSLTIGINGPWGSGKSTLLKLISDQLKEQGPKKFPQKISISKRLLKSDLVEAVDCFQIIEFNPWAFSGRKNLEEIFLEMLLASVGTQRHKHQSQMRTYAERLEFADRANPLIESFRAAFKEYYNIKDFKSEANKHMASNGIRLVVLIDDLDRLLPSEVLVVFQLVKQWANFDNTIFIIAFDKAIVAKVFQEHFKIDGLAYLEKVVQVDYNIPAISPEKLESMFFTGIEDFMKINEIQLDRPRLNKAWIKGGIADYFENIRDMTRFFNALQFKLADFHKNIDVHDFIVLEVIRLFDFPLYEFIRSNYMAIKQPGFQGSRTELERMLDSKSGNVYKYVFESPDNSGASFRIRHIEYFDRYFSFDISKKDMREEELQKFLSDSSMQRIQLIDLINNNKVEYLLRRLATDGVFTKPDLKILNLLDPMLYAWESQPSAFALHWAVAWDAIKAVIKASGDLMAGYRRLIERLASSTSQFNPAFLMFNWILERAVDTSDARMIDRDLQLVAELMAEKHDEIVAQFKRVLENYKNYFTFSDSLGELHHRIFFPSYARFFPSEYEVDFRQMVKSDIRIFRILDILVKRDSQTQHPFAIDPTYEQVLLPSSLRKLLLERLSKINVKTLSIPDGKTVEFYLKYLKKQDEF